MQSQAIRTALDTAIASHDALQSLGIQPTELKSLVALRNAVRGVTGRTFPPSEPVFGVPQFEKFDAQMNPLPESATEFVAVMDHGTGLLWSRHIGKASNWEKAKTMAAVDLCGAPAHLPTDKELESIIDRSKRNPACDTTFFGDTKTNDWYWTSTELKSETSSPSGLAWLVLFGFGIVGHGGQHGSGFVRACRRVSPGQF